MLRKFSRSSSLLSMLVFAASACGDDEKAADGDVLADTSDDAEILDDSTDDTSETQDDSSDSDGSGDGYVPAVYTFPACDALNAASIAGCVDRDAYRGHLEALAGERMPGSPKWQEAQDRCESLLTEYGFEVSLQETFSGANVIGVKLGTEFPDEFVVVSAHYDGVPNCDAVDDNATGVAGVLEISRILGAQPHKRTLVAACWDEEEEGLVGSDIYADSAALANRDIRLAIALEMIGYTDTNPNTQTLPTGFEAIFPEASQWVSGRGNRGDFITLVVGDDAPGVTSSLESAAATIGLPSVTLTLLESYRTSATFADLRRSDHAPFWGRGFPAMMITDTANFRNPNYHCYNGTADTLETIDLDFAVATTAMTASALHTALNGGTSGATPAPRVPACSLTAQDCPEGERCVALQNGAVRESTCIAEVADPAQVGEDCTRPSNLAGDDTCAKGLFCSFYGTDFSVPLDRICSPYCRYTSDCAEGTFCFTLGQPASGDPIGVCRPGCNDVLGNDCPGTQRCSGLRVVEGWGVPLCIPAGLNEIGEACEFTDDCATGVCTENGCAPWCESDAECTAPATCVLWSDFAYGALSGVGFCE